MSTISLSAKSDYGLTGQYIARITGRHPKFTFEREFIGSKHGKRNESSSAEVDDPGLYICVDVGKRGKDENYWIVAECGADELRAVRTDKSDAMAIAKQMVDRPFTAIVRLSRAEPTAEQIAAGKPGRIQYEILSAVEAAKEQSATTVAAAVDQIVALLGALPPKLAKEALAKARAQIVPPKSKPSAADEAAAPATAQAELDPSTLPE